MPPIAIIRSLQWAGFHKTRPLPISCFFQCSNSPNPIASEDERTLYPRESSTRFPVTSNAETTMAPPDASDISPIPGLTRSLFVVVIVSGVIVLVLAVLIPVYCLRHRKRNRRRRENIRPTADLELAGLGDDDQLHLYDAPRPDSTTLPMQVALLANERFLPEVERASGSPLEDMLNRFNTRSGSILHRRLESEGSVQSRIIPDSEIGMAMSPTPPILSESGPSYYQDYSRSRSTLGPASPPLAVLRSPTIASFVSSSPRASSVARGKQPMRHSKSASKSSTRSNKLRKKSRRRSQRSPPPEPEPPSPMSIFGGFGRASAGSMSNWVSWWDSSEDEGEGREATIKRRKRRNK